MKILKKMLVACNFCIYKHLTVLDKEKNSKLPLRDEEFSSFQGIFAETERRNDIGEVNEEAIPYTLYRLITPDAKQIFPVYGIRLQPN